MNKVFGYVLTGVLSVGIIGGIGTSAFAAAKSTTTAKQTVIDKSPTQLDEATKAKVQKMIDDLKTDLSKLGVTFPERGDHGPKGFKGDFLANLDAATKEKVLAIFEKEKAGTISSEEARTQLAALGVILPERGGHGPRGGKGDRFANLDEATRTKAQAIMDKIKAGTITHEEAKTQLEALGITGRDKHEDKVKTNILLENLDEATKAKAQALIDSTKAELTKLGIKHFHL
jgi:hypothetical protein